VDGTLNWTGERFIPGEGGPVISYEHLHRYLVASRLVVGRRVLDVGSGEGYGTAMLGTRASFAVGVEIDPQAVSYARSKYGSPNTMYAMADMTQLPMRSAAFDVVVCFEAIEHVADSRAVVANAHRVLDQGGIFVVSTPNKATYSDDRGFVNEYHEHEFTADEFVELLHAYFPVVELFGQRVTGGSFVWPVEDRPRAVAGFFSNDADHPADALRDLLDPMYFVALCSRGPIDASLVAPSIFIDRTDALVAEHETLSARVGELELRVFELETHQDRLMNAKDKAERMVLEREAQIKALREQLERAASDLVAVRETVSWRVTRPLRAVSRAVRGRTDPQGLTGGSR
jgi:SAM-dependent methyltransferase